jgi:hypothetical protein
VMKMQNLQKGKGLDENAETQMQKQMVMKV